MYRFTKINGVWLGKSYRDIPADYEDIKSLVAYEEVVCLSNSKEKFAEAIGIKVSEIEMLP